METDTTPQLLTALRDCGLYTPEQVAAAERTFAAAGDDARLAAELQAAGLLTAYQARKVKAGRTAELLFGPFLVLDKIGEGGMGKVYRAVQQRTGQVVALKVVRPHLMSNATVISRYKREARAAASLNHPNIVSLFDADDVNGRYYIAMEYVDGIDLSKMMKEFGRPPASGLPSYEEAAEYARQVALGLQHAHQYGLVHRDIKPSNLLVYGERALPGVRGQTGVKILDMGLVRSILDTDDGTGTELTRDGTVVGTPDYMAPEQAKNSKTVDHRADLYALGCTLYYLLKGQPPFPDGSPIDKLLRHQLDPPPDLRRSRPDVPAGLVEVIDKLLRKNADDRYQTAAEVAVALAPYSAGRKQAADRSGVTAQPGPVAHEPFSFTADPDAIVRPVTPPANGVPPASVTTDDIPEATIVSRPPSIRAPRRPSNPVPGATSVARGDAVPSSGNIPSTRAARSIPRPPPGENTPVGPVRRRERGRQAARRRRTPVVMLAVVVAAIVVLLVVIAILAARKDPPSRPTAVAATPPEPPGLAAAEVKDPPPAPAEPPPGPVPLPPVAEWLPDRTTGVVVVYPQPYWKKLAADPAQGLRVAGHMEALAGRTRFDPRTFERGTVAFVGRLGQPVAVGEGPFLTPNWVQDLGASRRVKVETVNGQNAYVFGTPWTNAGPRAGVVLGGKAYAIGADQKLLRELATRAGKRPPENVPAELTGFLAATRDPNPPLVTFAATGLWSLPDGSTLAEHRVRTALATVRLVDDRFEFELVLTGGYRDKLREFVSVYLGTMLTGTYPALKPFAAALTTGEQSLKQVGDEVELRVRGRMKWADFHDALEKLLPPPEKG